MRRLGELNIGVFDDFDPVAPGVEKIEKRSGQQFAAGFLDERAHCRAVVDDEPEMTAPVVVRVAALDKVDELIAELDEGIAGAFGAQREIENPAVKRQGLLDVADLERNMVNPDQAGSAAMARRFSLRLLAVPDLLLAVIVCSLLADAARSHYIGINTLGSMPMGRPELPGSARASAFSRRNSPFARFNGRSRGTGTRSGRTGKPLWI